MLKKILARTIWWKLGKTLLKPYDELTEQEIKDIRLVAKRLALHKAVDVGLFDSNIKDLDIKTE